MGVACHNEFPFYCGYGDTYQYFELGIVSSAFQKVKDEFQMVEIKDRKICVKAIWIVQLRSDEVSNQPRNRD